MMVESDEKRRLQAEEDDWARAIEERLENAPTDKPPVKLVAAVVIATGVGAWVGNSDVVPFWIGVAGRAVLMIGTVWICLWPFRAIFPSVTEPWIDVFWYVVGRFLRPFRYHIAAWSAGLVLLFIFLDSGPAKDWAESQRESGRNERQATNQRQTLQDLMPTTQLMLRQTIDNVRKGLPENANAALKKHRWIEANRFLCSRETGFFGANNKWHVEDWVGEVVSAFLDDKGEVLTFEISLKHAGNTVWDGNIHVQDSMLKDELWAVALSTTSRKTEYFAADRPGSLVRFSGSFTKGDMHGDNECLAVIDFDDTPELMGKDFVFDITKLEVIR